MFDWKDQNGLVDQIDGNENSSFDSIVLKVCFYSVLNICTHYDFKVLNREMEHKSP